MIEISLGKLVLLALIALIVLGPEKLPGAASTVGALLRRVRSGWDNVRSEVERELEVEEIRRAARAAAAQAETAQQAMKATARQVHEPLTGSAVMTGTAGSALASAVSTDTGGHGVQSELPLDPPAAGTDIPHGL